MEVRDELTRKYLTQKEVADLFRVTQATVKNWRDAGLLMYFQPPGSRRALYLRESVEQLERNFTKKEKASESKRPAEIERTKPEVSSKPLKEWRIN